MRSYVLKNLLLVYIALLFCVFSITAGLMYFYHDRQTESLSGQNATFSAELDELMKREFIFLDFLSRTGQPNVIITNGMQQEFNDLKNEFVGGDEIMQIVILDKALNIKTNNHELRDKVISAMDWVKANPCSKEACPYIFTPANIFQIIPLYEYDNTLIAYLVGIQETTRLTDVINKEYQSFVSEHSFLNPTVSYDTSKVSYSPELYYQHSEFINLWKMANSQIVLLLLCFIILFPMIFLYYLNFSMKKPFNNILDIIKFLSENYREDYKGDLPKDPIFSEIAHALLDMDKNRRHLESSLRKRITQEKHNLEIVVKDRTVELERARDEAVSTAKENRQLGKKLQDAIEDERKNIAQEVHDNLNAILLAIKMHAVKVMNGAEEGSKLKKSAESITKMSTEVYNSARNLVRHLRPETIDTLGLEAALEELIMNYQEGSDDKDFALDVDGVFEKGQNGDSAIAIYRIVQEAVSNILKHSNATKIKISLSNQGDRSFLVITDNGCGFNVEEAIAKGGLGIISMRERTLTLGGTFEVISTDKGSSIEVSIPFDIAA